MSRRAEGENVRARLGKNGETRKRRIFKRLKNKEIFKIKGKPHTHIKKKKKQTQAYY